MKRTLAVVVFGLVIGSLQAADKPKPNTLTPQEIADGWLLLFDGETTFGWRANGELTVQNGVLRLGGEKEIEAATAWLPIGYRLELEYRLEKGEPPLFGDRRFGLLSSLPEAKPRQWAKVALVVTLDSRTGHGNSKRVVTDLSGKKTFGDSLMRSDIVPRQPLVPGFNVPAHSLVELRNIRVQPLELKPIFNGKDLAGWKEHPGKKSKFSVEDGTIRIQNGPGDLQSEGQWDDFVLQLECKTNGNRLNSGVFFRCRPGEYQQGYEAQIHNGFGEPKEYTIEEYDPKTGKPLEKKKVKYAAMDYGTGAIYRRIPARKQVAKDKEWFTMTVIAAGRHMATWVNGVQVVDWTDNRPLANNGRNGCRLEKGPISFQGHDPTTDLSFRNIRIGELKK